MDLLYFGLEKECSLAHNGPGFGLPIDTSEVLLSKLETAGKVPSKDKFRCMVCWVGCSWYVSHLY
jgi:hypothetical protein